MRSAQTAVGTPARRGRYGAPVRRSALTIPGALALVAALAAPAHALTDVSVASRSDAGANPPGPVNVGSPSGDGSRILFASPDTLAATAPVPARQLYVRDVHAGRTLIVSAARDGRPADAAVEVLPDGRVAAAISADGRFAVFSSRATNLDGADADGGGRDVFRKDLVTGVVRVVSTTVTGAPGPTDVAGDPDVSADGARVVFSTGAATDIWNDTTGAHPDLVVRDLLRGGVAPVSIGPDGVPLTGPLGAFAISADGWTVVFESAGTVMARDLRSGPTRVIGPGTAPDVSGDGRVVVYEHDGRVWVSEAGAPAPRVLQEAATSPTVSADGRRVAFVSTADTAAGDANGQPDAYVRDLTATAAARVSRRVAAPEDVARAATTPIIAANGGAVAFGLNDGPAPSASPAPLDQDLAPDALVATLAPTDVGGPVIHASVVPETASSGADVSGVVTDPSGVASLVVAGTRVQVGADGRFSVNLNLAVGVNTIAVRAADGAGNVAAGSLGVTRVWSGRVAATAVPRATRLRVVEQRINRKTTRTLVRFTLAPRASRVWVRVAQRMPRPGSTPAYVPLVGPRAVSGVAGSRGALLLRRPLRTGIYQVRVTVVSPAGTRVSTLRHIVRQPPPPVRRATTPTRR